MTADFQRVYGLRLVDVVIEREEAEILDLIQWLPPGSAFSTFHQNNQKLTQALESFGWHTEHELLLGLVNLIRQQTYVIGQVNSQKRLPEPKPVPGPLDKSRRDDGPNSANGIARALLAAQRKG